MAAFDFKFENEEYYDLFREPRSIRDETNFDWIDSHDWGAMGYMSDIYINNIGVACKVDAYKGIERLTIYAPNEKKANEAYDCLVYLAEKLSDKVNLV